MLEGLWPKANWGLKVDKNQWTSARKSKETELGKIMGVMSHTRMKVTFIDNNNQQQFVVVYLDTPLQLFGFGHPSSISLVEC